MIAETAYYLAEKRGFRGGHALDDWLAAEQQVRQVISPASAPTRQRQSKQHDKAPPSGSSNFEKFAATQAAGDGIQGDTLKKRQTTDEKIGANMADRK